MIRRFRPRLLVLTAIAAAISIVTNAMGAVTAASAPPTRLGVSIQKDMAAEARTAADRNRALDMREQAARATEARLKAELTEKAAAATKAGPGVDAVEPGEQYDSLARVYQAMKPARAAAVFEQLEMDVQMQVAKRIRDRAMAAILAAMSAKGAAALSMALARKSAPAPTIIETTAIPKGPTASPAKALTPSAGKKALFS
jgi:flagellar motility protein MotE (MotC chaperone)